GRYPDRSRGSSRARAAAGDLLDLERDAGAEEWQPRQPERRLGHPGVDDVAKRLEEGTPLAGTHALEVRADRRLDEDRRVEARQVAVERDVAVSVGVRRRIVFEGRAISRQLRALRDLSLEESLEQLLHDFLVIGDSVTGDLDGDGKAAHLLADRVIRLGRGLDAFSHQNELLPLGFPVQLVGYPRQRVLRIDVFDAVDVRLLNDGGGARIRAAGDRLAVVDREQIIRIVVVDVPNGVNFSIARKTGLDGRHGGVNGALGNQRRLNSH